MGKSDEESKPVVVAKTALELQRFKLAKLMKNPVSLYLRPKSLVKSNISLNVIRYTLIDVNLLMVKSIETSVLIA